MTEDQEAVLSALMGAPNTPGPFWRVRCPFCSGRTGKADKKGSLAVSKTTGIYMCWKCSEKGKVDLDDGNQVIRHAPPVEYVEEFVPPVSWGPLVGDDLSSEPGRRYVAKRLGANQRRDREACLGYCTEGYFAHRVIVPILDLDGERWLGYAGRDTTGRAELKYRYPKGMRRHVYNRAALYTSAEWVWVVEGTFDALAHWPNAVALLGKPSDEQVDMLATTKVPLAIALDGDAQRDAWALTARLTMRGVRVAHVPLAFGEDPATVDRVELTRRTRTALGLGV